MSAENADVVRRALDASIHHENEGVFHLYDPEVEVHDAFYGRVYRGLDGVREWFGDLVSTFDAMESVEAEEWMDAGDDVIAALRFRVRGKRSGVPVE